MGFNSTKCSSMQHVHLVIVTKGAGVSTSGLEADRPPILQLHQSTSSLLPLRLDAFPDHEPCSLDLESRYLTA